MKEALYTSGVLAVLVLGSLFFVFTADPETQRVVSPDGQFIVQALTQRVPLLISEDHTAGHPARVSPKYRVDPVVQLSHLTPIQYRSEAFPEYVFAQWEKETNTWHRLPTDYRRDRFLSEIIETGTFAVFDTSVPMIDLTVSIPPHEEQELLDGLLSVPPDGAVSGSIILSTRPIGESVPFLALPNRIPIVCDGSGMAAGEEVIGQIVDVRSGAFEYRMHVRWMVGEGCDGVLRLFDESSSAF